MSGWATLPEELLLVLTVLCTLPARLAGSMRQRLLAHAGLLLLVLLVAALSRAFSGVDAPTLGACGWVALQLFALARLPVREEAGERREAAAGRVLLPLLSLGFAAVGLRLFPDGSLPPLEREALGPALAVLLAAVPAAFVASAGADAALALMLVGNGLLLVAGCTPGAGWAPLLSAILFQLAWLVRAWHAGRRPDAPEGTLPA